MLETGDDAMARMVKKGEGSAETEPEEIESEATGETESEEDTEEEVGPARPSRGGTPDGGRGESEEEEDDEDDGILSGLREDVAWLKDTLGTIVSGASQEQRGPVVKRRGGRTVVRVRQAQEKEPPPPPPPPRGTKRLQFGGFGLRKARRSQ